MTDATDEAQIDLSADEAIVLFDLLSDWEESGATARLSDPAELAALSSVLCQLERQLVAPFKADYARRLEEARARLRGR